MSLLKNILLNVTVETLLGSTDILVNKIEFDSRKIVQNDLFVAINGTLSNGHNFIEKAIELGASAIICEDLPINLNKKTTYIQVINSNVALAIMSSNFYDIPSNKIKLIGITGTNGKTTVASLLYQLFKNAGYKVGLLSTVKIMVDIDEFPATHTTPDSISINYYLNEMVNYGCEFCFMEVSSHGIHQKRTENLHFEGGVFTNLSHDHLDYHATFAEYRDVKKLFFDQLPKSAFALTNIDDKNGAIMLQNTKATKKSYALKTFADYKALIIENQLGGLLLKINEQEVWTRLIGNFNAYNALAIYGVAIELGLEPIETLRLLSNLESVSGRFQYIISNTKITAIVDYAHTPDALENVLQTITEIRTNNEKVITIVGCGGDRDKTKRPIMAKIATEISNAVILTSDNPRTENADNILQEMEAGISADNFKKYTIISDRKQAIKTACQMAQPNDIILIAGKGHETYQEINGIKHPFDDLQIVTEILNQLNK